MTAQPVLASARALQSFCRAHFTILTSVSLGNASATPQHAILDDDDIAILKYHSLQLAIHVPYRPSTMPDTSSII